MKKCSKIGFGLLKLVFRLLETQNGNASRKKRKVQRQRKNAETGDVFARIRRQLHKLCAILRKDYNYRKANSINNQEGAPEEEIDEDDAAWQVLSRIIELGNYEKVLELCASISTKKVHTSPCTPAP